MLILRVLLGFNNIFKLLAFGTIISVRVCIPADYFHLIHWSLKFSTTATRTYGECLRERQQLWLRSDDVEPGWIINLIN